jgi:hypothetical protein
MVYFMWAGKDVAFSESAGKYFVPRACNRRLVKESGTQKYRIVF